MVRQQFQLHRQGIRALAERRREPHDDVARLLLKLLGGRALPCLTIEFIRHNLSGQFSQQHELGEHVLLLIAIQGGERTLHCRLSRQSGRGHLQRRKPHEAGVTRGNPDTSLFNRLSCTVGRHSDRTALQPRT